MAEAPWKQNLQPASYNGALFYVNVNSRAGGQRLAHHTYPKKDIGWAEPMGRRQRAWPVTAYLVYHPDLMPDVIGARDALIAALEAGGSGTLVLPTGLEAMSDEPQGVVAVETYNVTEHRESGGYIDFEILFVEAGQPPASTPVADTQSTSNSAAQGTLSAAQSSSDLTSYVNPPGGPGTSR